MMRPNKPRPGELWLFLCVFAAFLFFVFAVYYFTAWALVSIAAGFGASWPFWPTFFALLLGHGIIVLFRR